MLRAKAILPNGNSLVTEAKITVQHASRPMSWEFRNHVESVLSRKGCNMGACHGALAGKGGFRLSLRGYDPDTDFFNIYAPRSRTTH